MIAPIDYGRSLVRVPIWSSQKLYCKTGKYCSFTKNRFGLITPVCTSSHWWQNKYVSYSACKPNKLSIMLRIPLFFLFYFICIQHDLYHRLIKTTLKSKCFFHEVLFYWCYLSVYELLMNRFGDVMIAPIDYGRSFVRPPLWSNEKLYYKTGNYCSSANL